jgi:IclR family acetate operon transcriptional repressor
VRSGRSASPVSGRRRPLPAEWIDGDVPINRYLVRSVGRALDAVELVAGAGEHGMSLAEVSRALRMSKSSALALLRTLTAHGYLQSDAGLPRYRLGVALIRLGDLSSSQLPLAEICARVLREIAEETGLTARLAVAEDGYPVFVDRVHGSGMVRFHTQLGRRERPHSTAAGKAILAAMPTDEVREVLARAGLPACTRHTITDLGELLAELDKVRRDGFAVDDEEDAEGVFCVGAAFFNHAGRCAGALSITGIKVDQSPERLVELGRTLRRHADEVSLLIGGKRYRAAT